LNRFYRPTTSLVRRRFAPRAGLLGACVLGCLAYGGSALFAAEAHAAGPTPPDGYTSQDVQQDSGATPGSLWSETRTRLLIGMDGNARRPGDLVTVNIDEEFLSKAMADTDTSRESNVGGGIGSLFGLTNAITKANPDMGGEIGLSVTSGSEYKGGGKTTRESEFVGKLTCRVMAVEPNGNLRVWGWKEIRTNRESQYLVLTGLVRPRDIRADNTVDSPKIAEATIDFEGKGVIADKQGPGIGHRVLDHAWPF
jgi:flagellar L-ring protein FlgH